MTRVRDEGRQLFRGIAALLIVGTFAACGGDGSSSDDAADAATPTTASDATTTTPADDEDEATTGETGTTIDAEVDEAWRATAVDLRDEPDGSLHEFECPPDGVIDSVWGTDIYTDDSSVCSAAVHKGLITVEDGGSVVIAIEGPQRAFEGSERHGVTSLEYPEWPGSFSFDDTD